MNWIVKSRTVPILCSAGPVKPEMNSALPPALFAPLALSKVEGSLRERGAAEGRPALSRRANGAAVAGRPMLVANRHTEELASVATH